MFNLRLAKDYLLHRFKAKTRHGIHSPFVYHLLDTIIYDKDDKKVYAEIEKLRNSLITGETLSTPKTDQLLYRLATYLQPQNIIELGTGPGISTIYLQKAAPGAKVYALESSAETEELAKEAFSKAGLNNIRSIKGNFDDTLTSVINNLDKHDFVFVAGNYQKEAILKYFEWCLPKTGENTLFVFNDIYRSEDMKEVWNEIKAHAQVTVTIDLFWLGLVFFRTGQVKENFLIKI